MAIKLTRLEIVQRVLSAMDSENVASIGDTIESEQVALLLDSVYEDILSDYPWPHLYSEFTIELTTQANQLRLPSNVMGIDKLYYNNKELCYKYPNGMRYILNQQKKTDSSNVDSNGAYSNKNPTYWTSFDDEYITLDAYNGQLVANDTLAYGVRSPAELTLDTDVPDLPARFHPVLLNGVMAQAMATIKMDDSLAAFYEKKYKLGIIDMKRWAKRVNRENNLYDKNYARKRALPYANQLTRGVIESGN